MLLTSALTSWLLLLLVVLLPLLHLQAVTAQEEIPDLETEPLPQVESEGDYQSEPEPQTQVSIFGSEPEAPLSGPQPEALPAPEPEAPLPAPEPEALIPQPEPEGPEPEIYHEAPPPPKIQEHIAVHEVTTEPPEAETTTTEEPYESAIERLSCENPWFWNSFRCLYLDVRKRNYQERTRRNGITVAWILGPPAFLLLIVLLCFISVSCYLHSRVKAFERRLEEIRVEYEPGSIKLDDGTIRTYTPTQEEIDAYENMISTLISIF